MRRFRPWAWVTGAALLFFAALALMVRAVAMFVTFSIGGSLWDVLAALGTVGATVVAVALALRAWIADRGRAARFVSAWVTDVYIELPAASRYLRCAEVHVGNEGNEPVFECEVSVIVGNSTPLGPLSAPSVIAVLPPRRDLVFDISIPIRFREDASTVRVQMVFRDANGRRWLRDVNGELRDISTEKRTANFVDESPDWAQLGPIDDSNPIAIALEFYRIVGSSEIPSHLLAPEATGWVDAPWTEIKADFDERGLASMVHYPAPRVAWVKFVGDADAQGKTHKGVRAASLQDVKWMTVTLAKDRGWKVYSYGGAPTAPDDVVFPDEAFLG